MKYLYTYYLAVNTRKTLKVLSCHLLLNRELEVKEIKFKIELWTPVLAVIQIVWLYLALKISYSLETC